MHSIMYSRYAPMALAALVASAMALSADAFVVPTTLSSSSTRFRTTTTRSSLSMSSEAAASAASKKIVVVSPPGGVGEVAAVSAAKLGNSVRWFVVSGSDDAAAASSVSLPSSVLDAIAGAGGTIELAGADASSLLLPPDDASSAIGAVSKWCGAADGLVCTYDGADDEIADAVMNAVKVASREAAGSVARSGRVAVLPAPTAADAEDDGEQEAGGAGGLFQSLLGGSSVDVPSTLEGAIGDGSIKVTKLRHGELFGIPESSVSLHGPQTCLLFGKVLSLYAFAFDLNCMLLVLLVCQIMSYRPGPFLAQLLTNSYISLVRIMVWKMEHIARRISVCWWTAP